MNNFLKFNKQILLLMPQEITEMFTFSIPDQKDDLTHSFFPKNLSAGHRIPA